ncbi:MAG: heparinase II/III family protein [Phycisphaerales bacterium]|nr:MAG: heparinase II/III family protein [Phycisphaerales bacterium]
MVNRSLSAALAVLASLIAAGQAVAESSDVLSTLDRNHPRLMLKDKGLDDLKQHYQNDKVLQKCVEDVLKKAEAAFGKPRLTHRKIGPRLLHVSRDCLDRIYDLGIAYRWTGDEKYAAKAAENLLTVCAFEDWNPSHFLDTAEMSHAVGLGYDWLYSYLDAGDREKIKAGLIKNGLEPGLKAYATAWWPKSSHNWNQVCNGGLLVGALAIAESDPQYAERIVAGALESLPRALETYKPDGAWGEGPGYWRYATRYTAYGLTALQTALGKHFGLIENEGLAKAGNFPVYTAGPTGMYLNLADSGERASRRPMPCMFWLARTYHNGLYAESEHAALAEATASPHHLIWYAPEPGEGLWKALDWCFRGPVEVAVFRSAWDDPDALFVGVKAGYNQVNHGHLDLGNFELDALGVRWARDLGADNYNMPGYWGSGRGGKRWTYYRLNGKSHNIPLLGGEDQDPMATAKFLNYSTQKNSSFVLVDLSGAYEKFSKKSTRGVAMVQNRRAVLIQDEFEIGRPCEIAWGMTTDADIDTGQGGKATLTLKGRKLIARVLSPAGANFTVESAEQKPPERTNSGVRRLMLKLPDSQGSARVAVLLSPVWEDGKFVKTTKLRSLAQW